MSDTVDAGTFHGLLQYDPADNPIPLSKGRFAMFPTSLDDDGRPGFPIDAVPDLEGFRLIVKEMDGVKRFGLRHPNGKELTPMKRARMVQVWIGKQMKVFNTANLLASYILKEDVTDNEFGILIGKDGMVVESAADRVALVDELKKKCLQLPRVDLQIIQRPKSGPIDVTGKGYHVKGGVLYKENGETLYVTPDGTVFLAGTKKQQQVRLGLVLATAYPDFYQYVPGKHTEVDHINGLHRDNAAYNFRPVTRQQNTALAHRTGDRNLRPSPNSSHEKFKRDETMRLTPENITSWQTGTPERPPSLRRYKDTSFWVHEDGAVLRDTGNGKFVYASVLVGREGYMIVRAAEKVHVMMMKAFGKHVAGQLVMHLDDDKQNCALENLEMGTSRDNATGKIPVTLMINGVKRTYDSIRGAARDIGVTDMAIRRNTKRQRYGTPITTRKGVEFELVDPTNDQTLM